MPNSTSAATTKRDVHAEVTEASDKWTIKAIIEVPINQLSK